MRLIDVWKHGRIVRILPAFAVMDKSGDDFHIIPSPVFSFAVNKYIGASCFGFGVKWGFWGVGFGIYSFDKKKGV